MLRLFGFANLGLESSIGGSILISWSFPRLRSVVGMFSRLAMTTMPFGLSVNPRRRSNSGSKPIGIPGGTRTPLITRWLGKITPKVSNEVVCTIDLAHSFATLTGQELTRTACLDSVNLLDAFMGKEGAQGRNHLLQQDNGSGNFGLRVGDWKLVRLKQRGKSQAVVSIKENAMPIGQHSLFHLTKDPGEQMDVSKENPEVVKRMTEMLDTIVNDGRSRP